MLALADRLDEDAAELKGWIGDLEAGIGNLWNPDLKCYDAKDLRSGAFANCLGSGTFLAWYAGLGSEVMRERLLGIWDQVRFGVPSHDPGSRHFDPKRYWRGPVWPVVNSLIAMGLAEAGLTGLAERLRRETGELIRNHGFWEYFDPTDGSPCGGDNFSWTAAVWLAWIDNEHHAANDDGTGTD